MDSKKKKSYSLIVSAGLSTLLAMVLGFYLFFNLNLFRIHEPNILRWIPILVAIVGFAIGGRASRELPLKMVPLLLLTLLSYKLFNFSYFPFILVLIVVGLLVILITRREIKSSIKAVSAVVVLGIFAYYLLAQPLIIRGSNFGYSTSGELVNATVLWDFSGDEVLMLPSHVLLDENLQAFNLMDLKGKTHLVTIWASWCGPCMREKPELERLKLDLSGNAAIGFVDISYDRSVEAWTEYRQQHAVLGKQLISTDVQSTSRALNFAGIPMHFIVDEHGAYKEYRSFKVVRKILENRFATQ